MPLPQPPSSLEGSCTVIYGGTLYSYTQDAFLALPLTQGAQWTELEMGEKVSGSACVGTTAGEPGFFVVGGTGGSDGYTGLQKFTYSTGKWETITPSSLVTKERQWHGATYLAALDTIVVYAGSQEGVKAPSSQTFTIQASAPYAAKAYEANDKTRPSVDPILLPWSNADVCLIGGDAGTPVVLLFNPEAGWRDFGSSLSQGFTKDSSSMQAVITPGDDGSKSLYTFDLSVATDQVKRYVIEDASSHPVLNSAPVAKRDLTVSDWPEYNSTLAPEYTRQNYAIAQGTDGLVVFTGGNSDHPIDMFNTGDNTWLNSTQLLSVPEQKLLVDETTTTTSASSTTTTFTSSSTSSTELSTTTTEPTSTVNFSTTSVLSETSATSTSTDAPAVAPGSTSSNSALSSNVILGITLGSILAFLALLGLILLCLRRRRARKNHIETGHNRRDSGPHTNEKDAVMFSNGAHPPPSPGHYRGHTHQASAESYSSMAILMGRVGQQKPNLTRKPSADTHRSSMSSLHKQQLKSKISKPVLQVTEPQFMHSTSQHPALQGHDDKGVAFDPTVAEPRPRNGPLQPDDGMRRSSGWNRYWSGGSALQMLGFGGSRRNTSTSDQSSRYSESPSYNNPRVTQDSATVPPLNFQGPEVNSVNSGSPVVATYGSTIPFKDGMTGKIERPPSNASSGYSSGIPESVHEAWDRDESKPWGSDRAVQWNGAYNPSFYVATPLSPSMTGTKNAPSGVSKQPQLAMASTSSDMSWLNLGDQSRK